MLIFHLKIEDYAKKRKNVNVMSMIILFWVATLLLFFIACGFVVPRLQSLRMILGVIILMAVSVYGLYYSWGNSHYLPQFYSKEQQDARSRLPKMQKLLAEFRKEEYRLRFRLEENPNDQDAEQRLVNLLAIKALYWEAK